MKYLLVSCSLLILLAYVPAETTAATAEPAEIALVPAQNATQVAGRSGGGTRKRAEGNQ